MYTSMLVISIKDKNLKVPEWKLTESCNMAFQTLICCGMNML